MQLYVDEHSLEFTSTEEWIETLQIRGELFDEYQRFDLGSFLENWLFSSQVADWTVTSTYVDEETTLVNITSSIFYPDLVHFEKVGTYEGDNNHGYYHLHTYLLFQNGLNLDKR